MKIKKSIAGAVIILVSLITVIGLSGLNFLTPLEQEQNEVENGNMEKIYLTTEDGIKIAADSYEAENPLGWLVMAHMMPATKESWKGLAEYFRRAGYESLAIDLRGHGESDGGPTGYNNFSDGDHQKSIFDLKAAVDYLVKEKRAQPGKISFVGASVGANLALEFLSENPEFKTAVLLSAGLDYDGIKTEPLAKNLKAGQKIFLVSSNDDGDNAAENRKIFGSLPEEVKKDSEMKIYETGGHGTGILAREPELENLILQFIRK